MLQGPFDSRYRIVGIDPGTDTLGVSLLELDLSTCVISLAGSQTFRGHHLAREFPMTAEKHGDRFARLMAHRKNLLEYFQAHKPHVIACESPYFRRRMPMAFSALTECVFTIRQATEMYNPEKPLYLYDPPTVKNAVGVGGKNGDKEAMRAGVIKLTDLQNPLGISYQSLDEHSIDSIAVAYHHAKGFLRTWKTEGK